MSFINNKKNLLEFVSNKSFEQIKKELEEKNITVKETEFLYLLYSESKNPEQDIELHNQCNGIILEKESNKVICACQNKLISTIDYKTDLQSYKDIQIEYCEDGTLMRLYSYKDEWFVATTRCFDARNSFWISNKSYHDLFFQVFKNNIGTFSKEHTYLFILLHTDNRLVISHKKNNLIYLCNINNKNLHESFNSYRSWADDDETEDTSNLDSVKTTRESIVKLDDLVDDTKRGFIFRVKTENNSYITFVYDFLNFEKNKLIRGNNNRIHFRYLEILTKNPEFITEFDNSYPEHKFLFASIHHCLDSLVKNVHQLYMKSHVKHFIKVDDTHLYYKTLMHLHSIYKKENKIITKQVVKDTIYGLNIPVIARLLKWDLTKQMKKNEPKHKTDSENIFECEY
jgi:hypothetical protein